MVIQCNYFRWGFFVYKGSVGWLALVREQQKQSGFTREDDVEDDHSTGRAITAQTRVFEQGRGVGSNRLCSQPSNHQIRWGNESGLTSKQPNKNLDISKKHNLEKRNAGFNKGKKKHILLLSSVIHYNKASISYPGCSWKSFKIL